MSTYSQVIGDKTRYLVDDLDLEVMDPYDLALIDSCLDEFHSSSHDTLRMKAVYGIVMNCWDDDVWPKYNQWIYDYTKNIIEKGNYDNEEVKHELFKNQASAINNFGYIFMNQGNIPAALNRYHESLEIMKAIQDQEGIASTLNNIGSIYSDQGDFEPALDYFEQSLEIALADNDKSAQAIAYTNMGAVYDDMRDLAKAKKYYKQSLELNREIGDRVGLANSLNNIGGIYEEEGDFTKAIEACEKAVVLLTEEHNDYGLANVYNNIGSMYLAQDKIDQARIYAEKAEKLSEKLGYPEVLVSVYKLQYDVAKAKNEWREALVAYENYWVMHDSVRNIENSKATLNRKYEYAYQVQAAKDSIAHAEENRIHLVEIQAEKAEKAKHQLASENHRIEAENHKKQNLILYGGLGLLLIFAIFIFNRFRVTQRQNAIIAAQKNEVESQKQKIELQHQNLEVIHKEVSDSINYAQRLQQAILPSSKDMNHHLGDGFVMFQPKDVVSGDFYWMQVLDECVLLAVADCTGHGVPGALVSVVCSNALNRSVKEFGLKDPAHILDKTRELVIETFALSGKEVKDGMDISICALSREYDANQRRMLTYCGANNPIWIVGLKSQFESDQLENSRTILKDDRALIELKPNKQPVGLYDNSEPFTSIQMHLNKGDCLYLFTDGYADQFGGKITSKYGGGKKYKYKPLKQFILGLNDVEMDQQKGQLISEFETWKEAGGKPFEQVDDVCVIGVRV